MMNATTYYKTYFIINFPNGKSKAMKGSEWEGYKAILQIEGMITEGVVGEYRTNGERNHLTEEEKKELISNYGANFSNGVYGKK